MFFTSKFINYASAMTALSVFWFLQSIPLKSHPGNSRSTKCHHPLRCCCPITTASSPFLSIDCLFLTASNGNRKRSNSLRNFLCNSRAKYHSNLGKMRTRTDLNFSSFPFFSWFGKFLRFCERTISRRIRFLKEEDKLNLGKAM